MSKNEHAIG